MNVYVIVKRINGNPTIPCVAFASKELAETFVKQKNSNCSPNVRWEPYEMTIRQSL